MKHVRSRVLISGLVQGVWFRESTRRRADELGLSGWVRNLPDGRVEAEFEGPPDAVDQALAFVHSGPTHARVDDVTTAERVESDLDAAPVSGGFRIR
jgi:acylphosphatase